jgi:hypothetical protein
MIRYPEVRRLNPYQSAVNIGRLDLCSAIGKYILPQAAAPRDMTEAENTASGFSVGFVLTVVWNILAEL